MEKDYVSDYNERIFDTPEKITQCWNYLNKLSGEKKAIIFKDCKNRFGGTDYYFNVKMENGVYIVSLDRKNKIKQIVRF